MVKFAENAGELMSKKQKRVIQLLGVAGAVYLGFKYLLPIVIPFFIAVLLAKLMEPAIDWLSRRFPMSRTLAAGFLLLVGGSLLAGIGYWIGGQLICQIRNFIHMWPQYECELAQWLNGTCCQMESFFHLRQGCISEMAGRVGSQIENQLPNVTIPYVAEHGVGWIGKLGKIIAVTAIVVLATIFYIRDEQSYQDWKKRSPFGEEIDYFADHLGGVGKAYLKTEGTIMVLTMIICSVGLGFVGNAYSLLLGILIGLLDALPLFGTGTVFIPWVIADVFLGRWNTAVKLFLLYVICYILRQTLEPKLLGKKLGITPFEVVAAVYIGLKLFGWMGLFSGPIAWLLWKEIDKKYFLS